jgi:hypothetical protein
MSDAEKDAITGRIVREYAEARRAAAVMKAEIADLQSGLKVLAVGLKQYLEIGADLQGIHRTLEREPLCTYDFARLRRLLDDHAETVARVASLRITLKEVGIQPDL